MIKQKLRLDLLVSQKFKISRSYAKNIILSGIIFVNNIIINDPSYLCDMSSKIFKGTSTIKIVNLYQTNNFVILYKPYNLSVCRSVNTPKINKVLNESLDFKLSDSFRSNEHGLPYRIDKTTEGIILVTKTNEYYMKYLNNKNCFYKLYIAFHEDILNIKNNYQNIFQIKSFICQHNKLVFSIFNECFCEYADYSKITLPLLDTKEKTLIDHNGKNSITLIKKGIGYFLCILRSDVTTGRTHQIRATLNHIGYPICGDHLYNNKNLLKDRLQLFSIGLSIDQSMNI